MLYWLISPLSLKSKEPNKNFCREKCFIQEVVGYWVDSFLLLKLYWNLFQAFWDLVTSVILLHHFSRSRSPFWQLVAYLIGEIWWFLANELDRIYILQFSKKFCFVWFKQTFLWEAGKLNVHSTVEVAFVVAWIYVRRSTWFWNQWHMDKWHLTKTSKAIPQNYNQWFVRFLRYINPSPNILMYYAHVIFAYLEISFVNHWHRLKILAYL